MIAYSLLSAPNLLKGFDMNLLSSEEIEQMNAYLEEFPPTVMPPQDLSFFDVKRIAATLLHLTVRLDNSVRRENALVKERDEMQAVIVACLESLELVERHLLPEGERFASWSHVAVSMRAAREALMKCAAG